MANLGNPSGTIEILQKYNFNFQKKFGQNFLIDPRVLDKIIDAAEITEDDMVLEIGPGIGTMTQYLAEHAREVVAVEIDKNLIPILEDTLSAYENVTVINEDILKVDIRKLADEKNHGNPIKVVANLPYYITTPIFMESPKLNLQIFAIRPHPIILATNATITNPIENRRIGRFISSISVFNPMEAKKTGPNNI